MKKLIRMTIALAAMLVMTLAICSFSSSAADENKTWVSAWGTAPTEIGLADYGNIGVYAGNVTVRTIITPTASGDQLRVRLSNVHGKEDLVINSAYVARCDTALGGSSIIEDSSMAITYNSKTTIVIPAGKEITCDPVRDFKVNALEDIAISLFVDEFQDVRSMGLSGGTTYITLDNATQSKDFNLLASFLEDQKDILDIIGKILGTNFEIGLQYSFIKVVPILSSVDVYTKASDYSVVVVGDSTVANEFPLYLSQAIHESEGNYNIGVVGKGIIGNQLCHDGLSGYSSLIFGESLKNRFNRDVLELVRSGNVKYVIVKIGCNDIIHPVCDDAPADAVQPTAQEMIAAYKEIFDLCHEYGVKVIPISITQWKGNTRDYLGTGAKYTRVGEEFKADWKIAQDINEWFKANDNGKGKKVHDGYVDFVGLSRNVLDPDALSPEYTADGVHPNDALQRLWANNFPLSLIGVGTNPSGISLKYKNEEGKKVDVKTVSITKNGKNNTVKLYPSITPSTTKDKAVNWYSENEKVATVDNKGNVTAVGNGTARIVCETIFPSGDMTISGDNKRIYYGFLDECIVTVTTVPEKLSLGSTAVSVLNTKSVKLTATLSPADTTNKGIVWKSGNTNVATVDKNGVVTGVSEGTVKISATSKEDPTLKKVCVVTVEHKDEVTKVRLSRNSKEIVRGNSYTLTYSLQPSYASIQDVVWSSTDPSVATVDQNGKVTALKAGKTIIRCTSADNLYARDDCVVTVTVKATGLRISDEEISLYATSSKTLKTKVYPTDATDKSLLWKSSNKSVVTVDQNGKITAVNPGKATVACYTNDGGFRAACKVTVTPQIKTTSVKLNKTKLTIENEHSYLLVADISPSDASSKEVVWKSSDSDVVKVSGTGLVTGIKPGTATITCTTKDSGKKATCKVTVKPVTPESVYFSKGTVSVVLGKKTQLNAIILPTNATNKNLKWKSSDPSVVSVSPEGVVKGLKVNKSATITVTTESGNKTAKIKVKVLPVSVTGVSIASSVTLSKGYTKTLTATVTPSNATNKAVTWKSTNTKVATVDKNGKVTAVGKGTAYIICTTKDGKFTDECKVTVEVKKILGLGLSDTRLYLNKGDKQRIAVEITPVDASNKKLKWTSSDEKVATVSSKGLVTAVGKGKCTIRVEATDGSKWVATCTVTVL